MSDIKWIKVAVDMFEDSKIEFIRSLPEGDAIIVTWIQMMAIAGKSNAGGYLMVADGIPYTEQLLSNKLQRQPVILRFALETLQKLDMVNVEDGPYHITKWEKHQNVDGMEKVRLQTAQRVAKHRLKNKENIKQIENVALPVALPVTVNVTHGNATDIELELDKEKELKPIVVKHDIPYLEIISYLNEKAGTNYKATTKATREYINGRWKDGFRLDDFMAVIEKMCMEWKGTHMEPYLRPNTLFNSEKFESYINRATRIKPTATVITLPNEEERKAEQEARARRLRLEAFGE